MKGATCLSGLTRDEHKWLLFVCLVVLGYGVTGASEKHSALQLPKVGDIFPVFNCPPLPDPPPADNVNRLRPGNIKVVMNLGDSISAGLAMHSTEVWDVFQVVEYRGDVFSIGGNPNQYTIPNFLKNYNPNLLGASVGYSWPFDAFKWDNYSVQPFDPEVAQLGAAQTRAMVQDVPAQVDYLEQQLLTTYKDTVNFHKDWKMVTMLIGANNLCLACNKVGIADPDVYEEQLELIVTKLYKQIPRTLVNIMPMFNISGVYTVAKDFMYCRVMWNYLFPEECNCLMGFASDKDRQVMDEYAAEYRKRVYKVAERWQKKNLADFTVRVQPCVENLFVRGIEFLAALDCFHPNYLADIAFAVGLWNNFWTPQAEKETNVYPYMKFKCPNATSYIQ